MYMPLISSVSTLSNRAGRGTLTTGENGTEQVPTAYTMFVGGNGGGGAGADTGTAYAGGSAPGRTRVDTTVIITGAAGGIETGTINGTSGGDVDNYYGMFSTGTSGGGGGGQSSGGSAGNGGDGGFPGGAGGGGGGSINGTNSGVGGDGHDGVVYVIEYLG